MGVGEHIGNVVGTVLVFKSMDKLMDNTMFKKKKTKSRRKK